MVGHGDSLGRDKAGDCRGQWGTRYCTASSVTGIRATSSNGRSGCGLYRFTDVGIVYVSVLAAYLNEGMRYSIITPLRGTHPLHACEQLGA